MLEAKATVGATSAEGLVKIYRSRGGDVVYKGAILMSR